MTNFEKLVNAHHDEIVESMVERYRSVLEADGRILYNLYIWDDGKLEGMECVDHNSWLKPNDPDRELYPIVTIECPNFDWRDLVDGPIPDDEADREAMRQEAIDSMVEEYKATADEQLEESVHDYLELESMGY